MALLLSVKFSRLFGDGGTDGRLPLCAALRLRPERSPRRKSRAHASPLTHRAPGGLTSSDVVRKMADGDAVGANGAALLHREGARAFPVSSATRRIAGEWQFCLLMIGYCGFLIEATGFPREKSIRQFEFDANPAIDPVAIHTLASCDWVKKGLPLCLIGDSATGKSHLLVVPAKTIACYDRVGLLCIDEPAELPSQLLTEREERNGVAAADAG